MQALTLLARISGMLINRQEIIGLGGGPVEVEHRDHGAIIRGRLEQIASRRGQPAVIDVTPNAKPAGLLAARVRDSGERE